MTLLDGIAAETFRGTNLPVLETERLVLRAPRIEDSEAVTALLNDRRIAENLSRAPHPYTLADAEAFIASANRTPDAVSFVITLSDGTLIGCCGVSIMGGPDAEPGYWIGIPYWGQGYATEALRALIDHAFDALAYQRLQARARISNPASRRVLEKCGFQWTGAGLIRVRALGSSVPVDRFRLDRGRWPSFKSQGKTRPAA